MYNDEINVPASPLVNENRFKVFLNVPTCSIGKSHNNPWLASESRWDPEPKQFFFCQTLHLILLNKIFWCDCVVTVFFLPIWEQTNFKTSWLVRKHLLIFYKQKSAQYSLFTSPIYNFRIPYVTLKFINMTFPTQTSNSISSIEVFFTKSNLSLMIALRKVQLLKIIMRGT